jgi:2,4-didehydro-3-deoxy-L-rhamnonate hydrolase
MKLIRYGKAGQEKPGIVAADGSLRSVVDIITDWDGEHLSPKMIAKVAKINPLKLPLIKPKTRLGPCVALPKKFIAIGLNTLRNRAWLFRKSPLFSTSGRAVSLGQTMT